MYTGWPRKNATLTIANFKEIRGYIKLVSALTLFATFADLHVRKLATFTNVHSYTHAYCSFVLLNEAITIVSGSHCAHALLICFFSSVFVIRFTGKIIQQAESSTSKMATQSQCATK